MTEEQTTEDSTETKAEETIEEIKAIETEEVSEKTEEKPEDKTFRDFFSEEYKKDLERFATADDLMKSMKDMRNLVSTRIKVPGEDASEEDVEKYRAALGVPKAPEEYALELPEGMEMSEEDGEFIDLVKPIAHENNIPQKAFQEFVVKFKELEAQLLNQHIATVTSSRENMLGELKSEMGRDFEGNVNLAVRAFETLGGDEIKTLLNNTKLEDGSLLGDHPSMVRFGAKLGRQMSEDGMITPVGTNEAQSLSEQINELSAKIAEAHATGDRATRDRLVKERSVLTERLTGGGQPVVGAGGRSI